MKNKLTICIFLFILLSMLASCESKAEKEQRKEQLRIELAEQERKQAEELAALKEKQRIERERELEEQRIKEEEEREAKALRDKYINNSLYTGATPYAYCYGGNKSCSEYGCSEIKVKTPYNSDVMVTIKRGGVVYSHAYIKAGSQYTFELPNGKYQPFFYYGKGWNPNKEMAKTDCGTLKGGFIEDESFGKDDPQTLSNSILTYELILQKGGNFSTRPSNPEEAF